MTLNKSNVLYDLQVIRDKGQTAAELRQEIDAMIKDIRQGDYDN